MSVNILGAPGNRTLPLKSVLYDVLHIYILQSALINVFNYKDKIKAGESRLSLIDVLQALVLITNNSFFIFKKIYFTYFFTLFF